MLSIAYRSTASSAPKSVATFTDRATHLNRSRNSMVGPTSFSPEKTTSKYPVASAAQPVASDVVVRHGDGRWSGLDAVRLCSERLFPVCSPKLISGRDRIKTASDLLKFPLLRLSDWNTWSRWFEAADVVADLVAHGPTLNSASMLIDAAIDGQGIALARTTLAAWDVLNGRLVLPINISLRMPNTYWIVCPKVSSNVPKIASFRSWLLAEAAKDVRRLKKLDDRA
jgi:LysR family transcriptional regulator, glycine cleavage system transcriptional activator